MRKKGLFYLLLLLTLSFLLVACSNGDEETSTDSTESEPASDNGEPVELSFMYWGSVDEQQAVDQMLRSFEEEYPHIRINAQHVPDDYEARINTLMAADDLPDVAYLGENLALPWAEEGRILDMTPYMDAYPQLANRLPETYYYFDEGKTIGTNTAAEIVSLFYNKDIFEEYDIDSPPANANEAWTWDEFLETAQMLTIDNNGNNALDPDFNPDSIQQFGVSIPTGWLSWYPWIVSNGGSIANEDGTELTLNSPEVTEVFQNMQDLMHKYHVAPTPTQQENMPATSVRLQTGSVAMAVDGHWNILDFGEAGLNFGVGVLPRYNDPKTVILGAPTVIFADTEHPEEAIEFYLYHNDPEQVDLFERGLWMPLELDYYTEQEKIDHWTDTDIHPPEFKEAVIDYTLDYAEPSPTYSLRNWFAIDNEINSALDLVWTNSAKVEEALEQMDETVAPLLEGRYPRP